MTDLADTDVRGWLDFVLTHPQPSVALEEAEKSDALYFLAQFLLGYYQQSERIEQALAPVKAETLRLEKSIRATGEAPF